MISTHNFLNDPYLSQLNFYNIGNNRRLILFNSEILLIIVKVIEDVSIANIRIFDYLSNCIYLNFDTNYSTFQI